MSAPAEHAQLDDWDQLIQAGAQGGSRGALVQAGAEAMSYEELCQAHIDAMLQVGLPCLCTSWLASSLCVASSPVCWTDGPGGLQLCVAADH